MKIESFKARQILDSRGQPTIEVDVRLASGEVGRASVPSGASTGEKEAVELRDGDRSSYEGKGVLCAIDSIEKEISSALVGMEVSDQALIDSTLCALDGTPDKSRLGANAILAVSLSCARAASLSLNKPLYQYLNEGSPMLMPVPMMNVLNGGAHANNNLDIQEFMLMPIGAKSFRQALQMGAETFYRLKSILQEKNLSTAVGDEGGFAPYLNSHEQALDLLSLAVEKAGYQLGEDIVFALDVAASELYHDGFYQFKSNQMQFSSDELIAYYQSLIKQYPIVSIEDGLSENDWSGWKRLTNVLGHQIQIVGDDLFVTNKKLLEEGVSEQVANAILIKLNQIGTLTETRETMRCATAHDYACIVSHRSGETEDVFIADLAVGSGCGQIKTGSLSRSDRTAKYNQLIRIEEYEGFDYPGRQVIVSIREKNR